MEIIAVSKPIACTLTVDTLLCGVANTIRTAKSSNTTLYEGDLTVSLEIPLDASFTLTEDFVAIVVRCDRSIGLSIDHGPIQKINSLHIRDATASRIEFSRLDAQDSAPTVTLNYIARTQLNAANGNNGI